jgi:hypothetical protein
MPLQQLLRVTAQGSDNLARGVLGIRGRVRRRCWTMRSECLCSQVRGGSVDKEHSEKGRVGPRTSGVGVVLELGLGYLLRSAVVYNI